MVALEGGRGTPEKYGGTPSGVLEGRCRANSVHIRQSSEDSGLGLSQFQCERAWTHSCSPGSMPSTLVGRGLWFTGVPRS